MRARAPLLLLGVVALAAACDSGGGPDATLVGVASEAPGANCAAGGAAIRIGVDDDGDGVLEDEEVSAVQYICSAVAGPAGLVDLADEPPGSNCPTGGVAIETGLDDDGDGTLDASEIDQVAYVCGGGIASNPDVYVGDLLVANQLDARALVGVHRVVGSLVIDAPRLATLDISTLEQIDHDLDVGAIETFDAPALETVGGHVEVTSDALESLRAPVLASVAGSLSIQGPWLTELDLSSLASVGSSQFDWLRIGSVHLGEISLPSLTQAATIDIEDSPWVTSVGAPALASLGVLALRYDYSLAALDFPALTSLSSLTIRDTVALPTCAATALAAQTDPAELDVSGTDDGGTCP